MSIRTLSWAAAITAALLSTTVVSQAGSVVTFDDLQPDLIESPVPDGYAGGYWENFFVLDIEKYAPPSGLLNGTFSSPNIIYNGSGAPASYYSDTSFNLDSFSIIAAARNDLTVIVVGLLQGVRQYSSIFTVNTDKSTLAVLNWKGIDKVDLFTTGGVNLDPGIDGTVVGIDNIAFSAVPGPVAGAGLPALLGVAGLVAWRRRKKNA